MTFEEEPIEGPLRWKDEPRAEGSSSRPEQRVARLMRRAAPMTLSEGARLRIQRRVQRHATAGPVRHRPPWRAGLVRWAAIAIVFFASGVVVAAAGIKHTWRFWEVLAPSVGTPRASASARRALTREHRQPSIPVPLEPADEPPVPAAGSIVPPTLIAPRATVTTVRASAAVRRLALDAGRAPGAPAPASTGTTSTTSPPSPSSPLSAEADLLKGALMRLRRAQDGEGALAELDAYFARFPDGILRPEADATRAEALLSLGRDREALRVLDGLALRPRGREAELRVIRGELRAASDCLGAIADFDEALAAAVPDGLAERALYGRASCRSRVGDRAGAGGDLDEYARRFPAGRFASAVRRARGL